MSLCDTCKLRNLNLKSCEGTDTYDECIDYQEIVQSQDDAVNAPAHYTGGIECIDYLRDKLTPAEFTGFCMGNVLKYCSRWRKKDGVQDLKKAMVYLGWAIENEEKRT